MWPENYSLFQCMKIIELKISILTVQFRNESAQRETLCSEGR